LQALRAEVHDVGAKHVIADAEGDDLLFHGRRHYD